MFKRFRSIKIIGNNRYELYLSFVIVVIGFCYSAVRPQGYNHVLVATGSLVLGFVCALNAVMDYKRMNVIERIIGLTWFGILLFLTPWMIWDTATIGAFSPR